MGIVFRQSVKATITTVSGAVLGALFNYWQPKYFATVQVGLNRYLVSWAGLIQYFVLLGMHNTIVTFLPRYADSDVRRRVLLCAGFIVPFGVCAVLAAPYFLLKDTFLKQFRPEDILYISRYYSVLPLMVLIWSVMTMADAYLITRMKVAVSSLLRDVVLRLANIAFIFLFAAGLINFDVFIGGTVLAYLLPTGAMLWIAAGTEGFGWSLKFRSFSRSEWKEIIHFSQYHLLAGMALNLVGYIDTLLLPGLDKNGLKSLAPYAIAVFIASMLSLPFKAMSGAAFPSLNEAFIAGNMARLNDLFRRSGINILIVGACMMLLIVCNLNILVTFLPAAYRVVVPLTFILILGRVADVSTGMNGELISISSHYKFFFYLSLSLLIALFLLCRLLIPLYGVYGAAWSATMTLVSFNIAKTIFLWQKFRLHPFSMASLHVLAAAAIAGCLGWFLPVTGARIPDLILKSAVVVLAYGLMLLWLRPSDDLHHYLLTVRKNKRLF